MTPADKLREAARMATDGEVMLIVVTPGQDAAREVDVRPLAALLDTHVAWAHEVQVMVDDGLVSGPIDDRWPGLAAALALADALGVGGGEGAC